MTIDANSGRSTGLLSNRWGYAAIFFMLTGLAIASFKIFTPYSFWLDELYSVTISSENWQILYQLLLDDVHPPLYQVVLKAWIIVFGNGEVAARSLSWIFAVASIYPLWRFSKKQDSVFLICTLIFLCSNTLFAHYANEARSYAMALFFATLVTTSYLSNENRRVPASLLIYCFLLSQTHYFGLILAGLILAFCFFENLGKLGNTVKVVGTGLLALIWPVHHALHGTLLHKTGGHFWIEVHGVLDSYGVAASIVITRLGQLGGCIFILILAMIAGTAIYAKRQDKNLIATDLYHITLKAALLVFIFASILAGIDLVSPMSTTRNYIVLLPLIVILMASFVSTLSKLAPRHQTTVMTAVCFFAIGASALALKHMRDKYAEHENWKGASAYLNENADGKHLYFVSDKRNNPILLEKVYNFYLNKQSKGSLRARPYFIGETKVERPALLFFAHFDLNSLKQDMANAHAQLVFPAPGVPDKETGVFLLEP